MVIHTDHNDRKRKFRRPLHANSRSKLRVSFFFLPVCPPRTLYPSQSRSELIGQWKNINPRRSRGPFLTPNEGHLGVGVKTEIDTSSAHMQQTLPFEKGIINNLFCCDWGKTLNSNIIPGLTEPMEHERDESRRSLPFWEEGQKRPNWALFDTRKGCMKHASSPLPSPLLTFFNIPWSLELIERDL